MSEPHRAHDPVPGSLDVRAVLAPDPLYRLLGGALARPWVLGVVLFAFVVVIVVFGTSARPHFVYADF